MKQPTLQTSTDKRPPLVIRSFMADAEYWRDFISATSKDNVSASSVLRDFIQRFLGEHS